MKIRKQRKGKEVNGTINLLSNGKALTTHAIPAEILKHDSNMFQEKLAELFRAMQQYKSFPLNFKDVIIAHFLHIDTHIWPVQKIGNKFQ